MKTATVLREELINMIKAMPEENLSAIEELLNEEKQKQKRINQILSLAGSWNDMPDQLLKELTTDLHKMRALNSHDRWKDNF